MAGCGLWCGVGVGRDTPCGRFARGMGGHIKVCDTHIRIVPSNNTLAGPVHLCAPLPPPLSQAAARAALCPHLPRHHHPTPVSSCSHAPTHPPTPTAPTHSFSCRSPALCRSSTSSAAPCPGGPKPGPDEPAAELPLGADTLPRTKPPPPPLILAPAPPAPAVIEPPPLPAVYPEKLNPGCRTRVGPPAAEGPAGPPGSSRSTVLSTLLYMRSRRWPTVSVCTWLRTSLSP